MRKFALSSILCAICALGLSPAQAEGPEDVEAMPLQVSRIGDIEMSCGSLSEEAMLMREIIGATQDIKDEKQMQSHGISAIGAVGGFVVGTVTGGIGLAAAGMLLDHNIGQKSDAADGVQDIAKQRRSLMVGIYNAKGCQGPIEHALNDPEEQNLIDLAAIEPAAGPESGAEKRTAHYNN